MIDEPPSPDALVIRSVRPLRAAEPEDVKQALAFALRYRGRKRTDAASEAMAEIIAERLFEHLAQSGFVVMAQNAGPTQAGSTPRAFCRAGDARRVGSSETASPASHNVLEAGG